MHRSVGEGESKIGEGSREGRCRDGDNRMGLSAPTTWPINKLSLKSFIAVSSHCKWQSHQYESSVRDDEDRHTLKVIRNVLDDSDVPPLAVTETSLANYWHETQSNFRSHDPSRKKRQSGWIQYSFCHVFSFHLFVLCGPIKSPA